MVSNEQFRELALTFRESVELPHFENTSFRVNKKIFATLNERACKACLKLSEKDQDLFSLFDASIIYPVPNKWGKQGWTFVELKKVKKKVLSDALLLAYCEVAPKKLKALYQH